MTFGSGGEPGSRPVGGAFDFGLGQSSVQDTADSRRRDRRRRSGPDRHLLIRALVIVGGSALLLGGSAAVAYSMVQASEAEVRADSAAFCADIASTPGVLSRAGFGWPTETADVPTTIAGMKAYQERWSTLATTSPPTIRADIAAVATAAGRLVSSAEASQTIDRARNLAAIESVTSQTAVVPWALKYCS